FCCVPPRDPHSFPTRRSSDLNDRIYLDAGAAKFFNVNPDKAGRGFPDMAGLRAIHPDDLDKVQSAVAAVRRTGGATADCTLSRRSEEHTSELQSRRDLVCRLL